MLGVCVQGHPKWLAKSILVETAINCGEKASYWCQWLQYKFRVDNG